MANIGRMREVGNALLTPIRVHGDIRDLVTGWSNSYLAVYRDDVIAGVSRISVYRES